MSEGKFIVLKQASGPTLAVRRGCILVVEVGDNDQTMVQLMTPGENGGAFTITVSNSFESLLRDLNDTGE